MRLDQLRRQDAMHSSEQCVAAHQFEVSTQLFNTSCSQVDANYHYEYIRLHTSPLACPSKELVPAATQGPSPGQENPAGGVRNSNWGGVHARDYTKASPGILVCLALHALPAAHQRICRRQLNTDHGAANEN